MLKKDLKVKIKIYIDEILEFPVIRLGVFRLVDEKTLEASGDPIDVLMRISEEESRSKKGSYIEVEVISPEAAYVVGETPRYKWRRKLAFSPERLLKVGVLRRKDFNKETVENFSLNDLEWYGVPKDSKFYVFEGLLEPKVNDIILVVLETDRGRNYLKPVYVSKSWKFSRIPQ